MPDFVPDDVQRFAHERGIHLVLKKRCADPRERMGQCMADDGFTGPDINVTPVSHDEVSCPQCASYEEYQLFIKDLRSDRNIEIVNCHAREVYSFDFWSSIRRSCEGSVDSVVRRNRAMMNEDRKRQQARLDRDRYAKSKEGIRERVNDFMPVPGQLVFDGSTGKMTGDKAEKRGMA